MRPIAAALTLTAATFFVALSCDAQSIHTSATNSPAATASAHPKESPSEVAHHVMLTTPEKDLDKLIFADVAFVLKFGTPEEAARLFAAVKGKPIQMSGGLVTGAGTSCVRVLWDVDIDPAPPAFIFDFEQPLASRPPVGAKVVLSGTYATYTREPFQITMSHASFGPVPQTLFLASKYWWPPYLTAVLP